MEGHKADAKCPYLYLQGYPQPKCKIGQISIQNMFKPSEQT